MGQFQEGQTATNPQTGEKIVFRGGQWAPAGGGAPAPAQPQAGPVYGAPAAPEKPREAPSGYNWSNGALTPIPGGPADPNKPEPTKAPAGYRFAADGVTLERIPGGPAEAGSVEQNKTAGFLRRAIEAESQYGTLGDVGPRSLLGQAAADTFPNATNYVSSPERQQAEQAERAFIAAVLRYDSGAAIPDSEFATSGRIYFPRPGDSEAVIKQKADARRTALEGLLHSAGPAGTDLQDSLAGIYAPKPQGAGSDQQDNPDGSPWGAGVFDANGQPLGPDGGSGYDKDGNYLGIYGSTSADAPSTRNNNKGDLAPDGSKRITGNDPGYAQFAAGLGDIVEGGLNNTVGLLANPVNTTLFRGMGYDNYTSNIGGTAREALGLPYGNETIGGINQAVTGGLSAAGAARGAANVFAGTTRNALTEFGSRPIMDAATAGTAAASGEVARQMGGGPVAQAMATVAGGFAPSALAGARNALTRGVTGSPPTDPGGMDVVAAGLRRKVPVRGPDVQEASRVRRGVLRTSDKAGQVIRDAEAEDITAIERAVARDVAGGGSSAGREGAGTITTEALQRHGKQSRAEAQAWYKRADDAAGGVAVEPRNAVSAIDQEIARLTASGAETNAGTIGYLNKLRRDLSGAGGITIAGLRDQRTNMRANITEANLDMNKTEAMVERILDAASSDIELGLDSDPRALNSYRRADQLWRERAQFRKQVTRQLLGPADNPRSPEAVASGMARMARDDFGRFKRLWDVLEPEEQTDIAATMAVGLGRDGQGNFSIARFLTQTTGDDLGNKATISPQAMRLMFGKEGAAAINDLQLLARAKTAAASETNYSRTGNVVQNVGRGLRGLLLSGLGFSTGGVAGAVVVPAAGSWLKGVGDQRAARLLMNPDFTRWLKAAPNTTDPRVINAHFARLTQSAAKSPIFAGDVKAFQEALSEAFAQSPGRVAASEQEGDRGPEVPQQ